MNPMQWLALLWRNFSPLEERLFAAVRPVLPAVAQSILDAQIAAVTRTQRHPRWTEICYYLDGHDGSPQVHEGDIETLFRQDRRAS